MKLAHRHSPIRVVAKAAMAASLQASHKAGSIEVRITTARSDP